MEEVIDDFIGKFWTSDRISEMEQLASEHGWQFTPRARFSEQATAIKVFNLFQGKKGKRITGIMQFTESSTPCTIRIYDYIYYSDGGKKKTTVFEMICNELNLPHFHIKPKGGLAGMFNFGKRKSSSGVLKFSKNYELISTEPEAVNLLIPDSVFHFIADQKALSMEGDGTTLLYYIRHKLIPVSHILEEYSKAMQIMDRLIHDKEKEFV